MSPGPKKPWRPPPKKYIQPRPPPPDRQLYEVNLSNFPPHTSEKEIYDFVSESVTFSALVVGICREPSIFHVLVKGHNNRNPSNSNDDNYNNNRTEATVGFASWTDEVLFLSHPKPTYQGRDIQIQKSKVSKRFDVMFPNNKRKRLRSSPMCFNMKEEACVYIVDVTASSLGVTSDIKIDSIMKALTECIGAPGYPRGYMVGQDKVQGLLVELGDPLHVAKAISLDSTIIDGKVIVVRPWLEIENFHLKLRRILDQIYGAPIVESEVKMEEF
jgi:hypothetical protein